MEKLFHTVLLVRLVGVVWLLHFLGDSFDTLVEMVHIWLTCGSLSTLFSQFIVWVQKLFFVFLFFLLFVVVFFFFAVLGCFRSRLFVLRRLLFLWGFSLWLIVLVDNPENS